MGDEEARSTGRPCWVGCCRDVVLFIATTGTDDGDGEGDGDDDGVASGAPTITLCLSTLLQVLRVVHMKDFKESRSE